jgi:hypothetical protein
VTGGVVSAIARHAKDTIKRGEEKEAFWVEREEEKEMVALTIARREIAGK